MSSNGFHHEDDVEAAYEAAEMVLRSELFPIWDNFGPIFTEAKIRSIARAVADAVIRSDSYAICGDITDIAGVTVEHAKP